MGAVISLLDGRRMERDGRERFGLYPRGAGYGRLLYALGLSNGRTKIGVCMSPRSRFVTHWVASEGAVTWSHLFAQRFQGKDILFVERDACARAAIVGNRVRRTETFTDLSRDDALRCVRAAIAEALAA